MENSRGGILRCMVCGHEWKRSEIGSSHYFPRHCNRTMRVITERELQEEKEFFDTQEMEENYMRSTERRGHL